MRSVTSSIAPSRRPRRADRARVDVDERRGLALVDVQAVPDDLLVVVGATLLGRALAQAGRSRPRRVGDELDDGVERLRRATQELVELATWSVVRG